MINKRGQSTETWRTPNNTDYSHEFSPITEKYCFRFER